jgi:hypothetical protein
MTSSTLLALWYLVCAALVAAPAVTAADRCDRSKRYETLPAQDQQMLQSGALILKVQTHPGSAYHTGYVYHLVSAPPELVMAVFTTYEDQRHHITDVLAAHVETQHGNYARVRFVYNLPWPLPNSEYVMNNVVVHEGETYLLSWDLHPSSPQGVTTPKHVEGYFRTQPVGRGALVIYCNYIIPGAGLLPDKINRDGLQAMQTTMRDTVRWVDAVVAASEMSRRSLARLRAMLAPQNNGLTP